MLFESVGNQVDVMDGFLSYNETFLLLDLLVIIHFFVVWIISFRRTGWGIDLWHFDLFMGFIISNFIQYPFISSTLNYLALGERSFFVRETAESILFINILGYIFIYLGRFIYDSIYRNGVKLNYLEKIVYNNISSDFVVRSFGVVCLFLACLFVLIQIKMGVLGNPRAYFLMDPTYRALYNGLSSIMSIITTFFIIRILDKKCRMDVVIGMLLIISNVFMGARAIFIGSILTFATYYIYKHKGIVRLWQVAFCSFTLLFFLIFATSFRGDVDLNGMSIYEVLLGLFFYGNSFSDLRDGALFFSYNGDELLYGKTYIAAMMSFVPRALSDFREMWAIGVVTASTVGYDTFLHPGLRISKFGEMFLNFGYIGIAILGMCYGYFLRKYDCVLKENINRSRVLTFFYAVSFFQLGIINGLFNSSGFFSMYVFICINVIFYFTRKIYNYIAK